jgi:hypothetical protein
VEVHVVWGLVLAHHRAATDHKFLP